MKTYKTQIEAARKGIITEEMKAVAAKEYRSAERLETCGEYIDIL